MTAAAKPLDVEPRARKPLKIRADAVAMARGDRDAGVTYALPEPPPGMFPEGSKLAMDHDPGIQSAYAWAGGALVSEGLGFMGYPYLAELAQRAEFRRPAEIIAKEMTRKWIKLTSSGTEDKSERLDQLKTAEENFRLRDHFREAAQLDGFYGRAHIYADTGDTGKPAALAAPLVLDPRTLKKGTLKGFRVIEPTWTYPNAYNTSDPLHEHFYKPQQWFVMGRLIHTTRLLTFIARPVPQLLKPAYAFGGLSLTQMAKETVDNWLETRRFVNETLNSFSKDIIKTNLSGALNGGGWDEIKKRAEAYIGMRNKRGVAMIDKELEDFLNVSTPLGTLDKLQAQAQEHMSSVLGIPLVILLGITPSGLNASSDGEIKTFYAWIKAQQEQFFTSLLTRALHMIQLHLWGEIDPDIGFEFRDLWEIDETAAITNRKTEAETDQIYANLGAIDAEEVRVKIAKDEGSPYHGLDLDKPAPGPPEPPEVDVPDDDRDEPSEGENPPPKP